MYPAPPRKSGGCESEKGTVERPLRASRKAGLRALRGAWVCDRKVREGSKEYLENNVDAEAGSAKVILPLITADSRVSEWFCEHRAGECLGFGQFG